MTEKVQVIQKSFAVKAETLRCVQSDSGAVILERASASEGSHKKLVCTLKFLMLIIGKMVNAETLRFAQSDGEIQVT